MSIKEEMTGLMNAVRNISGTNSPLNIEEATNKLKNIGLFETRIVSGTVTDVKNNGIAGIPIKAPSVEGYAFLFWLNSSSVGQVTDSYIESPTNSSTNIWSNDCFKGEEFQSVAVYVKNAFSELGGVIRRLLKTTITAQLEVVA